jgi:hypothetical protein
MNIIINFDLKTKLLFDIKINKHIAKMYGREVGLVKNIKIINRVTRK